MSKILTAEGVLNKHIQKTIEANPGEFNPLKELKKWPEYNMVLAAMDEFKSQFQPSTGMRWQDMVLEWHKKFGVDIGERIKDIEEDRFNMRQAILQEEVHELENAYYEVGTMESISDAICDILYVIIGTAIEFGLHEKLDALFSEVHKSNMSKLDENGNPVKREDGKILKSKLFIPPNLKPILES